MRGHEYHTFPEGNALYLEFTPPPVEEGHYTEDNVSGSEYYEFPENQQARSRERQSTRQDNGRSFRTQGGVKPKLNIGAAGLKMMSTVLTATTVVMVSSVLSEGTFLPGLGETVQWWPRFWKGLW